MNHNHRTHFVARLFCCLLILSALLGGPAGKPAGGLAKAPVETAVEALSALPTAAGGYALSFGDALGSGSFAQIPGNFPLNDQPRSLEFWAMSYDSTYSVVDHLVNYGCAGNNMAFGSMIYQGDTWWFFAFNENIHDFNTGVPADTQWHHHALTYDGTTVTYYLDGENIGSASRILATSPDCPFTIGIRPDFDMRSTYNGVIDEVRLWDYSRAQSDIQADMYHELAGSEAGLVGYWNFNEGSGQVIRDASPSAQDGYLGLLQIADWNDPQWVASEAPLDGKPDEFAITKAFLDKGALVASLYPDYPRLSNLYVYVHHPDGEGRITSVVIDLSAIGGGKQSLRADHCTFPVPWIYCGTIQVQGNVPTGDVTLPIVATDDTGKTAAYEMPVKVVMLMYDIAQQLRQNPSSILGKEVWVAAMVTESFNPDTITLGADIVSAIDLLASPSLVGLLFAMIGNLATSWTNSQILLGTQYYEFGNVLMVSWKPAFDGADFLPLGIPYFLRVRVGHSDPLHFDFDYLEVLEYEEDKPSLTRANYLIPQGYALYDYRDIQSSAIAYGSQVCTIGVVSERYTLPAAYPSSAFMRLSLQAGGTPFLVRAPADNPMPNLGDLALVCGVKTQESTPIYDGTEYGSLYDLLDATQADGYVYPYRSQTTSIIHGHEYIGDSALWLTVQCPADLHVYDSEGNHTGAVYDGSGQAVSFDQQIPGSFLFYGEGDSPERVLITNPTSAQYRVDVRGTDSGVYTQTTEIGNRSGYQTYFNQTAALPTSAGQVDTTLLAETPAAPTGLKVTLNGGNVALDWDDSPESDLSGYWVYRSDLPDGSFERLHAAPILSSAYTDSAATGAALYYVTAVDSSGNESGHLAPAVYGNLSYLPLMIR